MRLLKFSIALFTLTNFADHILGQEKKELDSIEIDPRQYVSVSYSKKPRQGKFDVIWNWETDRRIPSQKIILVDVDGEIRIDFLKGMLMKNSDFEGGISLEAEISGKDGTRKIEVNPYSEVGVERQPIGVQNEAPLQTAKKLINMIKELQKVPTLYRNAESIKYYADNKQVRDAILSKFREIEAFLKISPVNRDVLLDKTLELHMAYYKYAFKDLNKELLNKAAPLQVYKDILMNEKNNFTNEELANQFYFSNYYMDALTFLLAKTDIVVSYLESFEKAGRETKNAFISLINKDVVAYQLARSALESQQKKLKELALIDIASNGLVRDSILIKNANLILESLQNLNQLANIQGTKLEEISAKFKLTSTPESQNFDTAFQKSDPSRAKTQQILEVYLNDIADSISRAAARIIYKRLVYATIDLGKSGAKAGEVILIYVSWILDKDLVDGPKNPPRVPIGKYFIRETGWRISITDMFAMVKRRHEASADPTTLSPSNFKGSGGAVLMWTYNKEDKPLRITGTGEGLKVNRKRTFTNLLEPSIGFNVSYLDFRTDKDVEIGTGLQLGLFRNKIFFGYGINLMLLRPSEQAPAYFYIGFSFAKIEDLFKDSGKISSVQPALY